ncbi:MAG: hypothetical protein VKL42_12215 [Snowella sp.]|nr:hypothetical protein [Snowella sp.]
MAQITLDIPDELLTQLEQTGENPSDWLCRHLPDVLKSSSTLPAHLYRHILGFIASNPTPQQISDFRPTPEMQERLRTLLNRLETLTPSEQAELDEYERIEHLVIMLKAGNLRNLVG